MEKPGMDRFFPFLRAGLLAACYARGFFRRLGRKNPGYPARPRICLLTALALAGQAAAETGALPEPLAVEVESAPEAVLHGSWKVVILVDHPNPQEVSFLPPPLPPSLAAERVFTGGRMIPGSGGASRRWTAAEFSFIPQGAGTFVLGPFEINAADKRAFTAPIRLFVRDPEGSAWEYRPLFSWETPSLPLSIGKSGEFALLLTGGDPQRTFPPEDFFRGKVSEGLILETRTLSDSDRERGVVFRFRIIPLAAGEFQLGPVLSPGKDIPEIPAVRFKAEAAPEKPGPEDLSPPEIPAGFTDPAGPAEPEWEVPFPPGEAPVFLPFRTGYERARQSARELWEEGKRAEALAMLRRGERELFSGPALALLRRNMEQTLALEPGGDEIWRPLPLFGGLCAGAFVLILGIFLFSSSGRAFKGKKNVTSSGLRRYKRSILFLTVIFTGALLGLGEGVIRRGGAGKEPAPGKRGVLRTVAARRIPDPESGVNVPFKDGQSVLIRDAAGNWAYVEAPDGRAGWVPEDRVIIY
jgi:hypothetical protein